MARGGVAARAARSFAIAAVAASRSSAKRGEGGGGDGVRARGGGGGVAARGEPTASSIWRISRCSSVGGASLISALGGGVVGVRVEAIDESECARRWPGVVCGGFMYGGGSASSPPGLNKFGNA